MRQIFPPLPTAVKDDSMTKVFIERLSTILESDIEEEFKLGLVEHLYSVYKDDLPTLK